MGHAVCQYLDDSASGPQSQPALVLGSWYSMGWRSTLVAEEGKRREGNAQAGEALGQHTGHPTGHTKAPVI